MVSNQLKQNVEWVPSLGHKILEGTIQGTTYLRALQRTTPFMVFSVTYYLEICKARTYRYKFIDHHKRLIRLYGQCTT